MAGSPPPPRPTAPSPGPRPPAGPSTPAPPPGPRVDTLLDVPGLAALLGMSEIWVKRQVAARAIPHTRLGRSVRFSPDDVAAILAAARVPAQQPPAPGVVRDLGAARRRRAS